MKKLTYTTAIFMAMTASSVFAHHPAADIVDPEVYEMIDANVADTPHADMVFDDMGSAMGDAMQQGTAVQDGPLMEMAEVGVETDGAMDSANMVDTIDLMENVVDTLAE